MKARVAFALAALLPAACAYETKPADTAVLPTGVFSPLDQDVPAVEYARYAFSSSSRTRGNPVAGAQAVLAMDYIAGQLNTSSRWVNISALTQIQLLQGRAQARAAVGIAPGAPSQVVVNSLAAAAFDLQAGDQAKAAAALDNPAFLQPPAQTLARLTNLPYIQMANVSTAHAEPELFGPGNGGSDFNN